MAKHIIHWYTIYRKKNDQVICFGTVDDCMKYFGMQTKAQFHRMIYRAKRAECKYEVVKEALNADSLYD